MQFGARPLHRAIQKYLEDPLAEEILSMHIKAGDTLVADLDKENSKIMFSLKKQRKNQKQIEVRKLRFKYKEYKVPLRRDFFYAFLMGINN